MTVDVVPYITEITRNTTGLRTNRSRYGRYSVYQGESAILVEGFNLNPTSARLYSDEYQGGTPDTLTLSAIDATYTSFEVATVYNTDITLSTKGGWLGILVDGIDAINNTNDNSQSYNASYGTDGDGDDWNDDRYFFIFRVGGLFRSQCNQFL